VTPWELGVILTANYTFLNYLVLTLGFLLLDDRFLLRFLPQTWKESLVTATTATAQNNPKDSQTGEAAGVPVSSADAEQPRPDHGQSSGRLRRLGKIFQLGVSITFLVWIFYATTAQLLWMFSVMVPDAPVEALDPFRVANRYGLFGIMTRGRYEIEFQGSEDGRNWVPYPFRYKPQALSTPPRIYAPYQPRFDWNLWFASLGSWRDYSIVPRTEVLLLSNNRDVLNLFAKNPFPNGPPRQVRAVIWQYWFTSMSEKQTQGLWWRRQFVGLYAPTIEREPDGTIHGVEWPADGSRE